MSKIRKLKIERIIPRLKDVLRTATMKTADFPLQLKKETKLWRDTWIVDPIKKIIQELEEEIAR